MALRRTTNGVKRKQHRERRGRITTGAGRYWPLGITVVAVAALLLGCGSLTNDDDNGAAGVDHTAAEATTTSGNAVDDKADDAGVSDEELDHTLVALGFDSQAEAEDADVPEVNLETLEVKTPARTYQVEGYANTYVGEVTDELFIGISLGSTYTDQSDEVSVYICDSQGIATYLTGELVDGSVTLSDETAEIVLTIAEDEISGTVTLAGAEGEPFVATPATGNAGMYAVTDSVDEVDVWGRWIVLNDGRQRGSFCVGISVQGVCIGIHVE